MLQEKRDIYWDIVKGLGITIVVLGHSGCTFTMITTIIYFYHMALFFFVSGFFYNDKYSTNPYIYTGKKLKGLWWPTIKYIIVFILLHNIFLNLNIYSTMINQPMIYPTTYYSKLEILTYCFNTLFQTNYPVEMAGAMWFILPLIVAMITFCIVRYSANIFNFKSTKKEIYSSIIVVILGTMGIMFTMKSWKFAWRVDVALFTMPIVYCGYLYKKFVDKIKLRWYFTIVAVIGLYYLYKHDLRISYAGGVIGDPIRFYLATFLGIYLHLYITKFLTRFTYVTNFIACLGRNSFHIMALHFLSFKVVNLIDVIVNNKPTFYIAQYPYSNVTWWPLNLLSGLLIPVAVVYLYKLFSNMCIAKYKINTKIIIRKNKQ